MASTEQVKTEILEPMRALFRVPFGIEDPERGLLEYGRVLRRYSPETLKAGWSRIIEKYKRRDWPSVFEFVEQFDAIQAEVARLKALAQDADEHRDPWDTFCAKVLAFVKRDRRTFEAFRNAGVRAIAREFVLAFDSQEEADQIAAAYGVELDAAVGFHVSIEAAPKPSPTKAWVKGRERWSAEKPYSLSV